MSQGDVEVLRLVYERWARGDFAPSLTLFDDNITLTIDSAIPDGGDYIGREGVRAYMSVFLASWESLTIAAESFRDAEDNVLVEVRQTGIGRSSGVSVEHQYFQVWTFRAGKVVRLETIMSEKRALEAVGLRE
jgi:ketosteroid isomerase-like protein